MDKPRFINGCSKSVSLAQEFEAIGWDAWTCDILPSEGWDKHIQDDILRHLNDGWDLGIFHPDCTRIANSGVHWLKRRPERWPLMVEDSLFFKTLFEANIPLSWSSCLSC